MIEIVREVKRALRIPVAVKLSPLFTAFAHFARQLDAAGADGLVLFTRFHRVDIDVVELEVVRTLRAVRRPRTSRCGCAGAAALAGPRQGVARRHAAASTPPSTWSRRRWREPTPRRWSRPSLANGPGHLRTVRAELEAWMAENEWGSLDEMRGNMSFGRVPDPAAYERANFRMMFQ